MMSERSAGQLLLDLLSDRPIAYHPQLARAFGSVNVAIFLGQLLYWTGREADPEGWIWKTREDWTTETALSAREQGHAREILRASGVVEEHQRGYDRTLGYRVNQERLLEMLAIVPNRSMEGNKRNNGREQREQCMERRALDHDHRVPSEITSETTTEVPPASPSPPPPAPPPSLDPPPEWQEIARLPHPDETHCDLAPDTPQAERLFDELASIARLSGRRPGRRRFQTSQQKARFDLAADALDGDFDAMLDKALAEGINDLRGLVDYINGCARRALREREAAESGVPLAGTLDLSNYTVGKYAYLFQEDPPIEPAVAPGGGN